MRECGERPHHDREDETAAGPDHVVDAARHHLADAVEQQEAVLHGCVISVAHSQILADRRFQHRDRLAVDVVDDGGKEHQRDHQPPQAVDFHRMFMPPLISIVSPVRNELSDDARKATTVATSSGLPARPSSTLFAAVSNAAGAVKRPWNAVSPINPGATQLTRTPCGASSFASAFVRLITAPFDAAYAPAPGPPPFHAASDDILTMQPRLRAIMPAPAARHIRNALVRLTSITC